MPTVTQTAIKTALSAGPTKNYVTPKEADAIVKAAAHDAKGFDAIADLFSSAPVSYGNADAPGRVHHTPVLSEGAAKKLEQALWQHGDVNTFDLGAMRAKANAHGDVASLVKAPAAVVAREAKQYLMANYGVRGQYDEFTIDPSQLPAAARAFYQSMHAPGGLRDAAKLVVAGAVVYVVGVEAKNGPCSAWVFDEHGKQLGFCRPPGGGQP